MDWTRRQGRLKREIRKGTGWVVRRRAGGSISQWKLKQQGQWRRGRMSREKQGLK